MILYSSDLTQKILVNDFKVNNGTSLSLIGNGYYSESNPSGKILIENMVLLLENFARSTSPSNPIAGQFWFDNDGDILQLYDKNWENILLGTEIFNSDLIAEEFYTDDQIEAMNFLVTSQMETFGFATEAYMLQFISSSQLLSDNYTSSSSLNNKISTMLNTYMSMTEANTLVTQSSLLGDNYLTSTELAAIGLVSSASLSNYLTANQTITLSGDAAGSGSTAISMTLDTVATAGTFNNVIVNSKGLITGHSPLTYSEFETFLGYNIPTPVQLAFSNSSGTGYQKYPNGFIIQWITGSVDPGDNTSPEQTLTWALTFPTGLLGTTVSTNISQASAAAEYMYQVVQAGTNTSNVVVRRNNDSSSNTISSTPFIVGFGY